MKNILLYSGLAKQYLSRLDSGYEYDHEPSRTQYKQVLHSLRYVAENGGKDVIETVWHMVTAQTIMVVLGLTDSHNALIELTTGAISVGNSLNQKTDLKAKSKVFDCIHSALDGRMTDREEVIVTELLDHIAELDARVSAWDDPE